jgi:K+-transporting ATPase ATPase C chain
VRRDIVGSVVAIVVLTIGLGLVYPLVMTGVAQVTFHDQANGSQVKRNGTVVGSCPRSARTSAGPCSTRTQPEAGH